MDVVKTIRPGQPGSRRFQREWGDRLVAVRYRKSSSSHTVLTTIEVIVDEREHQLGISRNASEALRRTRGTANRLAGKRPARKSIDGGRTLESGPEIVAIETRYRRCTGVE